MYIYVNMYVNIYFHFFGQNNAWCKYEKWSIFMTNWTTDMLTNTSCNDKDGLGQTYSSSFSGAIPDVHLLYPGNNYECKDFLL